MALWIKTDGSIEEVTPQTRKKFKLEELQRMVGGYIEVVYLSDKKMLVVNEEGRIHGLESNLRASVYANQIIVGNVVLLTRGEM